MSEKNATQHGDEEEGKVRKELTSLSKMKAPWYFDAELQRRLADAGGRRIGASILVRPIPAYALSIMSIVALGIVGYYAFFHSALQDDGVQSRTDSARVDAPQQEADQPVRFERRPLPILPPTQETTPPVLDQSRQGPSVPPDDRVVESGVMERATVPVGDSTNVGVLGAPEVSPILIESSKVVDTTMPGRDTMRSVPAVKDTVDSTRVQPDSIKGGK